ncbi:VOC family protein [Vallicoccus soli]|uniref:VOC family protein n=1 Tax=Vallicoccus soli TaxID=2339232 RepID=A0A3A3Z4V8_9ACTN|nr:VOC family protein [Vallicoccus soli]RJK97988.1 VOC family protein [Vallicoccus soli]
MSVQLNPYLNFRDEARQAMDFYRSVLGGTLERSTFAEFGMAQDPADADKVMHSQLRTEDGMVLMAADTPAGMPTPEQSRHAVSLSGGPEDEERLRGVWERLTDGGQVTVPLEKAPWGDWFGMCSDRYGIDWMVNVAGS